MSRPPTPAADSPASPAQRRFHPLYTPTEWIEDYRPGNYHPVHFGDTLKDSRYRIIRKLGYGSFSTVWLARDQELKRYVALKILIADPNASQHELAVLNLLSHTASQHPGKSQVMTLVDFFEHSGPNGIHRCFVFDVMGPSVATALEEPSEALTELSKDGTRFPIWLIKSILYQTLLGIYFLHQSGVAHGDIQQGNILFSVKDFDSVREEELPRDDQVSKPVRRKDGRSDFWAPRYLALDQPLNEYIDVDPGFKIKISDFGGAFFISNPPSRLVTPVSLRSPELVFTNTIDEQQDIWSFGCLIFELFTGERLFLVMTLGNTEEEVDDEHFLQFNDVLGPLPQSLWSKYPRAQIYYNDKGEKVKNYVGELCEGFDPSTIRSALPIEKAFDKGKPEDISTEDADAVKRLLRWILDYDPAKRPSASELLENSWFVEIGAALGQDTKRRCSVQ
ncbi:kinase-like domain-containing protein [Aspergillus granulosus]|uniref:Kinase-like domain-containing protein n=1 Tax=Aspergillus granulosus TaxID=176169 RepID=A0ABR4H4F8_9EURO